MKKKAGIGNLGAEELERMIHTVLTRKDTQAQADILFDEAGKGRKEGRKLLEELFVQTPGADMGHNLQKTAAAEAGLEDVLEDMEKQSVAKNTLEFFEKKAYLTEAQRRFPELLEVANPRIK